MNVTNILTTTRPKRNCFSSDMGRPRTKPLSPEITRVLEVAGVPNLSALAHKVGLKESRMYNWPKRGRVPPDALAEIAEKLGKPIEAFHFVPDPGQAEEDQYEGNSGRFGQLNEELARYDVGPPDTQPALLVWDEGDGGQHRTRFQVVPRFEVRASAGLGNGQVDEEQVGEIAFEVNWMRRHLGRSGRGFASIEVRGDSMQPTLINGDEIIIDKHVQRVDVSGIYVIALRGDLLVKRIQRKLDGSLVVKSDNPAYEPEVLSAESAEQFRVVGRMVWPRVR